MSWFLAFLGFAVLIILHEFGHFAAAKAVGMRVERFSLFFGPMLIKKRYGETEYGIGPIPLGGYVKISGMNPHEEIDEQHAHRAYYRQPVWKRIVVIAAGPAVNIVLAFIILTSLSWHYGEDSGRSKVAATEKGYPAYNVLLKGDELLAVDGNTKAVDNPGPAISKHKCRTKTPYKGCVAQTPAKVTVLRDGQRKTLTLAPIYDASKDNKRTRLGVSFEGIPRGIGPITASGNAVSDMWTFTSKTVSTIVQLFKPKERKQVSGIVGSYETTRQAVKLGFTEAIYLLAVISLSLGVINLFPFLPLDGGHIFWALAEKLRGRAIPFSIMERAGFVGFALVIMLFLIGFTNDIGRLTGDGFVPR